MRVRRALAITGSAAVVAAAPVLALAGPAGASPTNGNDGPYTYTSADQGTCAGAGAPNGQTSWATDLGHRGYPVRAANPDGSYTITVVFSNGKWSSVRNPQLSGPSGLNYSPGDCDGPDNKGGGTDAGHRLKPGSTGAFSGTEKFTVTGGTYTARDGTCAGENLDGSLKDCTNSGYFAYHYGESAVATLTSYTFTYTSTMKGMIGKKYVDHGVSMDGGVTFTYSETGDVYNARVTPV